MSNEDLRRAGENLLREYPKDLEKAYLDKIIHFKCFLEEAPLEGFSKVNKKKKDKDKWTKQAALECQLSFSQ